MKKVLSLVLVLVMVLAVVPFSAFSVNVDAAAGTSANLALGKSYVISETNKGVTSVYHPIKCNAGLTDGKTNSAATATNIGNNSWFAVQTYSNCYKITDDGYGFVADITIDLGEIYNVANARVHFANGETTLSDGYTLKSLIDTIEVFGGASYDFDSDVEFGSVYVGDVNGADWASLSLASPEPIRYVKFRFRLNCDNYHTVLYGLIDELQVFSSPYGEVEYTNYAKSSTFKFYRENGQTIKPTRGYTAKLNDGISDVPVITNRKNPNTGKYNYNNGNWFGFFCNSGTSEQNCPDGYGYVWIDLGAVKEINKIRLFYANGYEPLIYTTYYSNDNVNFNSVGFIFHDRSKATYGEWVWSEETFKCRYLVIEIGVSSVFWALFNEIEIYGHETTDVAEGKSYTIGGVDKDEFNYILGYNGDLTDGVADVIHETNLANPETGVGNYSDGKYTGLFTHRYSPDLTNVDGYSTYIVVDLGTVCEISLVKLFFAYGYEGDARVSFSVDGTNYSEHRFIHDTMDGVNGEWQYISCYNYARYVRIEVSRHYRGWTVLSEIDVWGNPVA